MCPKSKSINFGIKSFVRTEKEAGNKVKGASGFKVNKQRAKKKTFDPKGLFVRYISDFDLDVPISKVIEMCLSKDTSLLSKRILRNKNCKTTKNFEKEAREKWIGEGKLFTDSEIRHIAIKAFVHECKKEMPIRKFIFNTCLLLREDFKCHFNEAARGEVEQFSKDNGYYIKGNKPLVNGILAGLAAIIENEAKREKIFRLRKGNFILSKTYYNLVD